MSSEDRTLSSPWEGRFRELKKKKGGHAIRAEKPGGLLSRTLRSIDREVDPEFFLNSAREGRKGLSSER